MVLVACVLASAMVFIDGSALTVALPKLRASFAADLATVQWVVNGYVLALASLTLIGGTLADTFGKGRTLSASCLAFGVASAACALAPGAGWLIVARVVQGIAAAVLAPTSLAYIGAIYPQEERNRAIGVWAAASAMTTAGGPILGGWLTDAFGWQWVFAINPPLALVVVGLLAVFAPPDRPERKHFDAIGAALLAAGLGALAWALSRIGSDENAGQLLVLAVVAVISVVLLAAYALWEKKSAQPMTPPRLLANRAFVGLNLATLLIYAGLSIMFFLVPFHLLDGRGLSPTDAGFALLPFALGVGLLSRVFGTLADKVGPRLLLIAAPLGAALAYAAMAFGKSASLWLGTVGPMALLGISFALLITPLTASVLSSLDTADQGLASGVNNAVSRIAQLAGVALAAGLGSYTFGFEAGLAVAAVLSAAGAVIVAAMVQK
jgi:EmrB/QacA subfamily drug resistance transporter